MKKEFKWLGPTGSTPKIGRTVYGEKISIDESLIESLLEQGLIQEIKPKKPKKTTEKGE